MKILGHTPEGDLIIQVSQDEWDGLQDGVKPEKDKWERWWQSEIFKLVPSGGHGGSFLSLAFRHGEIDGSIQSLHDIANGKIRVKGIGPDKQARLKRLLKDQSKGE